MHRRPGRQDTELRVRAFVIRPHKGLRAARGLLVACVSLVVVVPLVGGIGAHAGARTCFGEEVTIVRGPADNVVHGTPNDDVISTGAGDDVVWGRGGRDRICLGRGSDDAFGGARTDRIDGGGGNDVATKGEPYGEGLQVMSVNDWIFGRKGVDRAEGGHGADHLFGGGNDDLLNGYDGEDGNDYLNGGQEQNEDTCDAEDNDTFVDCEVFG